MQNYSYNLVGWDPSNPNDKLSITLGVPLQVNDKIWLPDRVLIIEEIAHELYIRKDSFGVEHYEDNYSPFVTVRII